MRNFVYILAFVAMMLITITAAVVLAVPYIISAVVFRFWQSEFVLDVLSSILALNDTLTDYCGEILSKIK